MFSLAYEPRVLTLPKGQYYNDNKRRHLIGYGVILMRGDYVNNDMKRGEENDPHSGLGMSLCLFGLSKN